MVVYTYFAVVRIRDQIGLYSILDIDGFLDVFLVGLRLPLLCQGLLV